MATLALTEQCWNEMRNALQTDVETAGFLLVGVAETEHDLTLLGRGLTWVPDTAYVQRTRRGLEILSAGFVPPLKLAADDDSLVLFVHTHPGGSARPSARDDEVNRILSDLVTLRTGRPYASLILGGTADAPVFSGAVHGVPPRRINRIRVIGRRLRVLSPEEENAPPTAAFDRQIRAFGQTGQELIGRLRVGVVGAGGTGSAVHELLVRLGIRDITVIDDDFVTETNLTRIHESGIADVGDSKVEVARRSAGRIGLGGEVTAVEARISSLPAAQRLRHCDVVFGCTDDNRGRAVLSRFAYWYLSMVIDTAFLVDATDGQIRGLFGRVTTVMPGAACLQCRGRIDNAQLAAEALSSDERHRLAAEGYVPGLGEPDPSVGAFTTLVGSYAVSELLERLFGYGGADAPTEVLLRLHDRRLSTNTALPKHGHYCDDRDTWGRGDSEPFLDQLWVE